MAKVLIYAHACTFSVSGGGFKCMSYMPFDPYLHHETIEAKNVAEIEAAKQKVSDQLRADDPQRSHFVSALLVRGERAPNGFKKLRQLEFDHDDQPAPDTATIGGIEFKKVDMGGGCTAFVL